MSVVAPVPGGSGASSTTSVAVPRRLPVRVSLDDIWPNLEAGMTAFLTELAAGFPKDRWISMYTYVAYFSKH